MKKTKLFRYARNYSSNLIAFLFLAFVALFLYRHYSHLPPLHKYEVEKGPALTKRDLKVTQLDIPEILEKAKTLPAEGILKKDKNFLYLSVSDKYIYELYPELIKHIKGPKASCLRPDRSAEHAHISLLPFHEHLPDHLEFSFEVENLNEISFLHETTNGDWQKVTWYTLGVKLSPDLLAYLKSVNHHYNETRAHISIAVNKEYADTGECVR